MCRKDSMHKLNLLMQENSSNGGVDQYRCLKRIIHTIRRTYTTCHTTFSKRCRATWRVAWLEELVASCDEALEDSKAAVIQLKLKLKLSFFLRPFHSRPTHSQSQLTTQENLNKNNYAQLALYSQLRSQDSAKH